jgi:membrane-bound lytic murein transglycosylase MltF
LATHLYLKTNKFESNARIFRSKRLFYMGWVVWIGLMLTTRPAVYAFDRYNHVVKYDTYFSKYTKRFFGPGFDWRHFKAQAVAESRLKSDVRSHVGAEGIMQIMPRTFQEIKYKYPSVKGTIKQPRWNIAAGIYYDRMIWRTWESERSFQDRLDFTFGAYNAGKGNIIKAQRIAKSGRINPNIWSSIEQSLPKVTGRRSRETIHYVKKIKTIKEVLR